MNLQQVEFPHKLVPLITTKHRYKVSFGGRGGSKSWGFARALLILGSNTPLRILCAREIQNSIKDSVHQLLKDQIELLNLQSFYATFENRIVGNNGTTFAYTGLLQHTAHTLKSYEGVDICWVEEAHVVSKDSMDILVPTIRKPGSEMWFSYNPELETDEVHQRFVVNSQPDTLLIEINWRDNPWHTAEAEAERIRCQKEDPDNYDHIWEGKCLPAVSGAIFFKEIQAAEQAGRVCNIPYDPMLLVHLVLDLGWGDALGTSLIQKHLSEIRVLEYVECNHTRLDIWSAYMRTRPYNWGRVWLPHDGFSGRLESGGKSTYDILTALRWDCAEREEITEMSIEEGIRFTRLKFPNIYFDKTKCAALKPPDVEFEGLNPTQLNWRFLECLKRYRRHENEKTGALTTPVKDPNTHGGDNVRYIALNADSMLNETINLSRPVMAPQRPRDAGVGM